MMKNTSSNIFLENIEKEIVHLYPNIVQSLQEGLGITDLDENFIFCNRAACRILGYSKNELLGMNLKDLIPSSQLESIRRENEIRKKGSSSRYDLVMRRKNGRLIHVFISAVPFKNRGGEIIGSFGLFRDITAQKKTEETIKKNAAFWEALIQNVNDAIVSLDTTNSIVEWNTAAVRIFKYSRKEALGKNVDNLIGGKNIKEAKSVTERVYVKNQKIQIDDTIRYTKSRRPVEVSIAASPIFHQNAFIGSVAVYREISAWKRSKEEIIHTNRLLRTAGDINQLIIQETDPQLVLRRSCQLMKKEGKYKNVAIITLNERGLPGRLIGTRGNLHHPCVEKVLQTKQPLVIRDVEKSDYCRECSRKTKGWSTCLPLKHKTSLFGMMIIGHEKQSFNLPREIKMLKEITGDLGFFLHSIGEQRKRKKAEEELKNLKEYNETIVTHLGEGILIEDTKGLITFVNPSLEQIIGYKSKELIGKHWKHIIPKEDLIKIKGKTNSRSSTHAEKYEARLKAKDGRIIPVLISAQTLIKGDKFVGVLSAFTDITDLVEARKDAQTANQAKSEFLANMSHEVRTPMNGIIGMTELALGTKLSREQFGYLEAIKEAGESLMTIINDILDFSKIEAKKIKIENLNFNFRDSLGDIVSAMALQAHKKDIELVYRVNSDIPDYLIGDPGRIRQILFNLISNAVKFTQKGEVAVEVRMKEKDNSHIHLQFTVRDTGIGIPEKQQEKIFKAFTQADGSTTRKYGGTGLGLTISTQLIHLMNGDIWVESKAGEGSRFHFTLRLGIQIEPKEQLVPVELLDIRGLPVLVVDDNATNRFLLKEMLANWNMKPTLASSGRSGLRLLKQGINQKRPFALAVIDSQMPEMDGFELARRIQSNPLFKNLRLMMLTSSGMRGDAARCRELGILAYLTKPVKQSELLNTIMIILSKDTVQKSPEPLITKYSIRESHKRLRILVVEDNPINQKVAAHILQKYGNTVILANDGKEALEAFKKEEFDLILMDVQMPVMDGFQATAAIRKVERSTGKHIPIIALTAHTMKGDREKCVEAGMDDYVSKPIKPDVLFQTIDELLLKNRSEE